MNCRFSFKQIKRSEVLVEFAQPKILAKIEKYVTKPIDVHTTFTKQAFSYVIRCSVKGGDGFNFQVEVMGPDLYSTFDMVLAKLESQLKRQKEKLKNHKHPETIRHLQIVRNEEDLGEEGDWDEIPVDAGDIIKYERARHRLNAS